MWLQKPKMSDLNEVDFARRTDGVFTVLTARNVFAQGIPQMGWERIKL